MWKILQFYNLTKFYKNLFIIYFYIKNKGEKLERKLKILHIEDEESAIEEVKSQLEELPVQIDNAKTLGKAAELLLKINMMENDPYIAIIVDIDMAANDNNQETASNPKIAALQSKNGLNFILYHIDEKNKIPLIFFSGSTSEVDKDLAEKTPGFKAFLKKDAIEDEVRNEIEKLIM